MGCCDSIVKWYSKLVAVALVATCLSPVVGSMLVGTAVTVLNWCVSLLLWDALVIWFAAFLLGRFRSGV